MRPEATAPFRFLEKRRAMKVMRGPTHLAVERERGPVVGHTLIGARILGCPHLGEHDTIAAVLLVAGPGKGVRRERGPVAP